MCVGWLCYVWQSNALAWGVSAARLVFLSRMPKASYLRALAAADLFLDTPHYGETPPPSPRSPGIAVLCCAVLCGAVRCVVKHVDDAGMFLIAGAHTTASDAMFGALPVLTLPRDTVCMPVTSRLEVGL